MKRSRIAPTLFLLSLFTSLQSWAGVIASSEVQITNITFSLPEYTLANPVTTSEAGVLYSLTEDSPTVTLPSPPASDTKSSWESTYYTTSAGGGYGSATVLDDSMFAYASAAASADGSASLGSGHTLREGLFSFSESGQAVITFNYLLRGSLSASKKMDHAMMFAILYAGFVQVDPQVPDWQQPGAISTRMLQKTIKGPDSFSDTRAGIFTFDKQVFAGQQWGFILEAASSAEAISWVNEPSPLWLLLVGLLIPRVRKLRVSG